ncbi:polyprenyl synthetase family protein [Roseinatronobacter bogoriensis]|uniref:Geranylgeranyl diphosphate synthase n=1 Tax=Roseinatronobacter bogoriensis subsp. barguzinensis TaxID=441209 RepID=A0A2K8KGL8_9RHOB|nr:MULTISPECIES: farnesyl diphosphate synthase [Rhodobaca]ATX67133.1 farnesyl-diphosphate synthase [Rhodobaca barguzinensis]MBB4206653.1 farnesyl diphosphate synthase [Rhodobaca bogoriensis DSM 18756]TDW41397.1 farnesyl diphosphate synthase [Rhodobaca barguzinensis]TDY74425.1 farnesyl diphosphate synthase [Rhodobaca bogoriensis DSM 18756]
MNGFTTALEVAAQLTEARLQAEIAALPESNVRAAMAYAARGGKKLRGFLVLETARLHNIPAEMAVQAAAAIEAIHAYSLVHDDLPAMDDDDLRRGQPTVHVKWDEATAILVGDALQSLAFGLLARGDAAPTPDARLALIASMAQAAGGGGMVLGQALDIAAETASAPLSLDAITALQAGKTGALIEWSACAGARMAGADPSHLANYARALGLAFQIADDILDVEGDAALAGKRLNKDQTAGKATFVSELGLEGAKMRACDLITQAQDALQTYGDDAQQLREAAQFVIARSN